MLHRIITKRIHLGPVVVLAAAAGWHATSHAQSAGQEILESQCRSCHALAEDAPQTLQELWDRKGPNLSSAGIKYKPEWLTAWLQNPVRIRPAGMFYGKHIKTGAKSDEIDPSSLAAHPKLSAEQAQLATEALMEMKRQQELINEGDYKPGRISITLGEMMFDKFKGCLACHQIEPGYGGLSGPEVYTAAQRLQEDYLISFMRDPQAWEPKTFMPNKHLKENDLQKLVHYFHALSQENFE